MHIVTHDVRFATVSEAAYKVDGLAVLGFFIEVNPLKSLLLWILCTDVISSPS